MSDPVLVPHSFRDASDRIIEVALPFALDALCDEYDDITARMARRGAPAAFSRDEWGYLLSFMRGASLRAVFTNSFGSRCDGQAKMPYRMARPRSNIAVWLPNNVSLLGPLAAILCLLTGARVLAKAGQASVNLTAALREEILNAGAGPVLTHLWTDNLITECFDRYDPRNKDWSLTADARVFFGSDTAALAVEALPHKAGTPFFAFRDHSSLVWGEPSALDDAALETLLRVFRVYGKAGCTSPQSLVLIDGTAEQAAAIADRMKALCDNRITTRPPVHIASDTFMAEQVARAEGSYAARASNGSAVFVAGGASSGGTPGLMSLRIMAQTREAAITLLPDNIQTVGYIATPDTVRTWSRALFDSRVLRLVPVGAMHNFGPFWDGQDFWRGLFLQSEIGA